MPKITATTLRYTSWILALSLAALAVAWGAAYQINLRRGPPGARCVAVTLDDGPNPPYTEKFLELLDRHGVKATFFFIGRNLPMYPATVQKTISAGHEIGNHSWNHQSLIWKKPEQTQREIAATDAALRSLGYAGPIPFRAPLGSRWGLHLIALWRLGRPNVLYDVEPRPPDYHRRSPRAIAQSALERVQPGSILLLHDGEGIRSESLEAAAIILPELRQRGFCFQTVTELLGRENSKAHPPSSGKP